MSLPSSTLVVSNRVKKESMSSVAEMADLLYDDILLRNSVSLVESFLRRVEARDVTAA